VYLLPPPQEICPQSDAKKKLAPASTPIQPKSDRQKQLDRLHALLKIACLKRDKYQCVMCGKPATKHPIHPYDLLDVSHIFAKSVWPLARSQPVFLHGWVDETRRHMRQS
jgi:hypothetical protein